MQHEINNLRGDLKSNMIKGASENLNSILTLD